MPQSTLKNVIDPSADSNSSNQFIRPDGGKTKSNRLETPSITLPTGGGSIKGIDEKFSVNAVSGTASFSILLPFSQARAATPTLGLAYNSGSGNGIFGLGWGISLPSIKRKTDKERPHYIDSIDSDTFLFSEAEDLVPAYKKENDGSFSMDAHGNYIIHEKDSSDNLFTIRFYKPRIEGLFARIERWSSKSSEEIKWRVITKENTTTLFGWTSLSRLSDPLDANHVFEWLPEFTFDDKGNCVNYMYKPEDNKGVDAISIHNRNRIAAGTITYTNLYLEKILYGNKTPYKQFGDPLPSSSDYLFQTIFDYGEYNAHAPFDEIHDWDFRPDAFSDYKSGFEIRTTRLCKRILFFHYFAELADGAALVKSLDFNYDTATETSFTFLSAITSCGYIKQVDGTYTKKSLPAIEFAYQQNEWNFDVKTISPENVVHAPTGLQDPPYLFTDLFSEGLSGILTEQADGWYYKHNLGDGKFEQATLIAPKPYFIGLGTPLKLVDIDADGCKQIVHLNKEPRGYFELSDNDEWQSFRTFANMPNIDLDSTTIRMLDLNGDGRPDLLISEDYVLTWYESAGREGYKPARYTPKLFDEEKGPLFIFTDQTQSIFLADMKGDGTSDLVRIRNGEICYWPNLGFGKFGTKVAMDNAPLFDYPDTFNPALLRIADIDGSGTSDVIYLGKNKFSCWMNLNGNSFDTNPFEIDGFPEIHQQTNITVADLLGNGVPCVVWSSNLTKDANAPLRYIDLMNSKKPYLMTSYKNNLGKEVALEYTPSTKFYIEDKLAGRPWATKLHFPVQCVSKTTIKDTITGFQFVSSYKYHHGYFDHPEREFRGFGMVEQTDSEDFDNWMKGNASNVVGATLYQAPVCTKSWFHTGAFLGFDKLFNQFEKDYWYEEMSRQGYVVTNNEIPLPDTRLIASPGLDPSSITHLTGIEWQEALRACKGMGLRSEVFAKDAPSTGATPDQIQKELTPFTVATHNAVIELIQPKGQNKYAIFMVKESEAIIYNYERITEDPRISHNLNILFDEYGHVLESAFVMYPRLILDASLPQTTKDAQNKTLITYVQNGFTNDIDTDTDYRVRIPSEVKTYELKGISKLNPLFALSDFNNILTTAIEVDYSAINTNPAAGTSQKRLIEHVRNVFYKNDLTAALPLHQLQSKALPFENYQQAYTPTLITDIYGAKVNDPLLVEGKFTHSEGDANWWIRSGSTQFIAGVETFADAQNRFYVPISFTDPFGSKTSVHYYSNYFLLIDTTTDALLNQTSVLSFNMRTLSPERIQDPNRNISQAISDELGFIKAMAVFGKGAEADDLAGLTDYSSAADDLLATNFLNSTTSTALTAAGKSLLHHATARFIYDLDVYKNSAGTKPVVIASIMREQHFQQNNNSPIQISFEYSNGLGQVVMKKVQAEPGLAKQVVVHPDDTYTITTVNTSASLPPQLRWIGNGRTVLNNKGKAVKKYEPYFSVSYQYENLKELVETGVTPLMYYDAMGRLMKTAFPDDTFSTTEFDSWKQLIYDQNDNILASAWYTNRFNHLIDAQLIAEGKDPAKEKLSAQKAANHDSTPCARYVDTMGKPILQIEHSRNTSNVDVFYKTEVDLDIEGNVRRITDARGNVQMQYKYDMLGNQVYQNSMDTGQRWLIKNVLGDALRTWDERNQTLSFTYDTLHRLTLKTIVGGDGTSPLNHAFEKTIYGEGLPNDTINNWRTKPVLVYDTAGKIATAQFDSKGNPLSTTRTFATKYKEVVDWNVLNPDVALDTEIFTSTFEYDALSRISQQMTPDGSIHLPTYNEAGLLEQVQLTQGASTHFFVKNIDYNEKRQRSKIRYGNDVSTNYYYDKETFRLIRLETTRLNNDPLQDLYYTFDPVGNINYVEDKNIPNVFFNNQKTTGTSSYTYDPLYRLIEATGKEHIAQVSFGLEDNWNDLPFLIPYSQGDNMAWRNYTQQYDYDGVGNMAQMRHVAAAGNWTRTYTYETINNRLKSTQVGQDANTFNYLYPHHPKHGFITELPHLQVMRWNFKEELQAIAKQKVLTGTPEIIYYVYDGNGQRVRKITERQAAAGVLNSSKKNQRIYVGGTEIYREYDTTDTLTLERKTCHVSDDKSRIAMIESRTIGTDAAPAKLVRYQFGNHLGSAAIEIDDHANIISYEEYHPYGTTSYQAVDKDIQASAKRYRYTSIERDEESGLEYHGARYYLVWLGRWLNTDPIGIGDGLNVYAYVRGNPLIAKDSNGKQAVAPPVAPPRSSAADLSQTHGTAGDLPAELARTPKTQTPLDLGPYGTPTPSGSGVLDSIINAFATISRWIRNYLPGIIAAPLAGIVEILGGLVRLIGSLFTWNGASGLQGLKDMGLGFLRIFGIRELAEDNWRSGNDQGTTSARMPESYARDMTITYERTWQVTEGTAARNGMHAWHASTNAISANRVGPFGVPFLILMGLYHESPLDAGSFKAEQANQGTVNHILDSLTDIIANIFGILIGLLIPRRWSVYVAALLGNQIPGPGDPDPTMVGHIGTGEYNTHKNPTRAWGQYPPPIGDPEPARAP